MYEENVYWRKCGYSFRLKREQIERIKGKDLAVEGRFLIEKQN